MIAFGCDLVINLLTLTLGHKHHHYYTIHHLTVKVEYLYPAFSIDIVLCSVHYFLREQKEIV